MSDFYKCKPSEILHLNDEYTAFCFDEACLYISLQMQRGQKPAFVSDDSNVSVDDNVHTKKVRTPKDVYAKFDN